MNIKKETILLLIFSLIVYLANGETISSGDAIPNSLLAFNLLENHTLNFDAFRNSYLCTESYSNCYFFIEANNGHLSSFYPIGSAIVTFPLYLIFYIYLKLTHSLWVPLDLTADSFEAYRASLEKLAASLTTAISVSIFYLSLRLKFKRKLSLLATFIFAFATNTWMTSSQGLWQHGISNLALVSIIFCLLKANRAPEQYQKRWLLAAGLISGLIPGIRPTSALYVIAAILYIVFSYRFKAIFFLSGLITAIPSLLWNLYYFGNLTGGYSSFLSESPYVFSLDHFIKASLGTLISPSRGLLIFSPIVLYSLLGAYQVFKLRTRKDEQLIGSMTIAAIALLGSYFFFRIWWAGHSYGPRFTTDLMPILCYLISYFLASNMSKFKLLKFKKLLNIQLLLFMTLLIFSTSTQVAGAFGYNPGVMWNAIPLNVRIYRYRLWNIRDNQIERHFRALFNQISKPHLDNSVYVNGLDGLIKQITDEKNQAINSVISVQPGSRQLFKAYLVNIGESRWFGYRAALPEGETRVRVRLFDVENHRQVSKTQLFISGSPQKNEWTTAIGSIHFPQKPGRYKLVFDLIADEICEFPQTDDNLPYVLSINVVNQI